MRDGTYTENVDVNVANLTIKSENGSTSCIVQAASTSDHVFEVTADYVNITGFTAKGATNYPKAGIYLDGVEHCDISDNTASNNGYGIYLYSSSNYNTLTNNTADSNNGFGIGLLYDSTDNNLTGNSASNNANYDFYSDEVSHNNNIQDLTMSSYPTMISFIYGHGIGIKSVITPETDPDGKVNIGKYVNLTDVTEDSWILLNISYNDADVTNLEEDSLRLYRWNETEWEEIPGSNVNTAKNYVYANVTNFSQIAPFGNPLSTPTPTPKPGIPGFKAVLAIAGLLAVAYLALRRKQ